METSITPFANGTSQPDTVRMLAMLDGHPRRPDYDPAKLHQLRLHCDRDDLLEVRPPAAVFRRVSRLGPLPAPLSE